MRRSERETGKSCLRQGDQKEQGFQKEKPFLFQKQKGHSGWGLGQSKLKVGWGKGSRWWRLSAGVGILLAEALMRQIYNLAHHKLYRAPAIRYCSNQVNK